jgi:hypothetical protein
MTKITKWLQLRFSNPLKPTKCNYCGGKLIYCKYNIIINLLYPRKPPLGAKDLNLTTTINRTYRREYTICQKCDAKYKVESKGSYYSDGYYKKVNFNNNCKSLELESILGIDSDINLLIKSIINTNKDPGSIISSYTIKKLDVDSPEDRGLLNKFIFYKKFRNTLYHFFNIKKVIQKE